MGNDLFGGLSGALGGIVGGLAKSGLVPQDDPNVKVFNAQQELADLQKQETEIYTEIGRKAFEKEGAVGYPAEADKLKLIQSNIAEAQTTLDAASTEKKEKEDAEQEATSARTCPSCGEVNPEGVNFCQECGTKLGAPAKAVCPGCGTENPPGTKFCGGCGARIGD
jgi:hypothetical protein